MNKLITTADIERLANDFGIDVLLLRTVIIVEAAGRGFDTRTGNIKIQFEPYHFKRLTGHNVENKVDVQSKEWEAYERAKKLNWEAALLATSWGMGQIMGFNYKLAGYLTIQNMINEFRIGEAYQVKGMLVFIKNQPRMMEALRRMDWSTFARLYNGPAYNKDKDPANHYDVKLKNAYQKLINSI